MSLNPLCARVTALRAATGLWSATVNPDHGLNESTRARFTFGHLTESDARRSASVICHAIGRVAVAATVAAVVSLGTLPSADAADHSAVRILAHGVAWQCHGAADCGRLLQSLGCMPILSDGRAVVAACHPPALARHSA